MTTTHYTFTVDEVNPADEDYSRQIDSGRGFQSLAAALNAAEDAANVWSLHLDLTVTDDSGTAVAVAYVSPARPVQWEYLTRQARELATVR